MTQVSVICTQRGRHDREHLADEEHDGNTWRLRWSGRMATVRRGVDLESVRTATEARYITDGGEPAPMMRFYETTPLRQFACPACPRNLQIATATWFALLDEAARTDTPEVDISGLRF